MVDARCLAERYRSGVGEYVFQVLARLPRYTPSVHYRYFYGPTRVAELPGADFPNVEAVTQRVPSKLYNASVRLLGWPRLDQRYRAATVWLPSLQSASIGKNSRLLMTIHDLSFERHPEFFSPQARLWHRLVNPRALCLRADAILALSDHTKRELVDVYRVPPERITVTYPGGNPNFSTPATGEKLAAVRQKYHLPERYVLSLGNLEPRKNFGGLIDAFHRLTTDAWLVLAGRPVYRANELYQSAARGAAAHRIRFLGYVDAADRPALYRLATCLAYPSYYEGFGLPVLEAMASGTPVVAAGVTSLPEIVGNAGLLVDPHDVDEIAAAVAALLHNDPLRERLRQRGLRQARRFSWDATAQATAAAL